MEIRRYSFIRTITTIFIAVTISIFLPGLHAQSTIFYDPGETYNNTDSRTEDFYGPIDISGCNSIHVTLDYSFSSDWEGSGNMESNDECNFTNPCDGDPTNPSQLGCQMCWDFLWVRYMIDGVEVGGDLIGEAGTTNAEQSGTIDLSFCVNGETTLDIEVYTQTWAGNESVTFSDITVTCRNDLPSATASPNPLCSGSSVQLDETSGNFTNWMWTGPNGYSAGTQSPVVNDFTSSDQGYYVVTADDANGCPFSDSVEVLMLSQPSFSVPPDVTVCEGLQVDVDTLINPSNTNLTYTYHDGVPPSAGNQINGLISFNNNTTISVIGTDANNCTDTQYVNLTVINVPVAPPANVPGPYCEGEDILLSASPPILPLITYTWAGPNGYMALGPNQTIPNAMPSDQGLYELTASFMGCTSQPTTVFVEITPLPAAPTVIDPTEVCIGETLMLSATGDPNVEYVWSGPNGFASIDQNPIVSTSADYNHQGIYSVTTSINGCVGPSSDLEVIINDTPQIVFSVDEEINCPGDNNGAISVMIPGGAPTFTYDWSDNQYDGLEVITGLSAGTYSVTVTDGNGCENSASITLVDPPVIQLFCDQDQAVSSSGAMDGIGEVFISGGTEPFIIEYDNGTGSSDILMNLGPGGHLITNLAEGTYQVTVTDANGCTANCSFVINQQSCDLTIDTLLQTDPVLCFGDSSAILEVVVSGGSGSYNYQWEDTNGSVISDSSIATGLPAGMYFVSVSDNNDPTCSAFSNFDVSQPFNLQLSSCIEVRSVSAPGSMDGIAQIRFSGGTQPYTLVIDGPLTDTFLTTNDSLLIDSLPAGDYNILLADSNGCVDSCTLQIQGPCDLTLTLDTVYFSACPEDSSLVIETIINNPTVHTIQIWNGDTLNVNSLADLPTGIYSIEIIDTISLCSDMLIVDRSGITPFNFLCEVVSPASENNADGQARIILDTVVSNYDVVIRSSLDTLILSGQSEDTLYISNLDTGDYVIIVTNELGCRDSCQFTINSRSCQLDISLDTAYFAACPETNSLQITTQLDTVNDNVIYIWNLDTLGTNSRSDLPPGIYTITALDTVNGCTDGISIDMSYDNPLSFECVVFSPPSAVGSNDGRGGMIIDSVNGPFSVSIMGHNYGNSQVNLSSDTVVFNNLDSGNYMLIITDSLGCTDTCSFFMPDGGCEIFSIDSIITIQPNCLTNGRGRIEVFASGGSGMYNYDWNVDSLDGQNEANNLRPGVYSVTVTDLDLGCVVQGQRTLRPVEGIDLRLDHSSFYCENDSVALNIELLAGASPFYLSINGESGIEFSTDTTFYLQRENPVIEITDSIGCSYIDSLLIREIDAIENDLDTLLCQNASLTIGGELFDRNRPTGTIRLENASQSGCDSIINVDISFQNVDFTYELIPPSCANNSNSQIRILSVDGAADFSLYINGQSRTIPQLPFLVDDLETGVYEVFIESSYSCRSDIQMISIEEPQQVEVSIQTVSAIQPGDTILLEGASNASISAVSWIPGNSVLCDSCLSTLAFPDMTTTYTLQITNEEGCTGEATVSVIVSENNQQYYIPNTFTPNGDGLNDFFTVYGDETSGTIKSMRIFDRWGDLLNEKRQIALNVEQSGWDGTFKGKELKPGVYVYSIEIISRNGEVLNFAGTITLLK